MQHLLDNPIYNALITAHLPISLGTENVRYYLPNVASFAGLKNNSVDDFDELHRISQADGFFILFSLLPINIPANWKLIKQIDMLQLVHENTELPTGDEIDFVDLDETNVAEMIALVNLTEPGPFLSKTIEFGNYTGIFRDKKLVSKSGISVFRDLFKCMCKYEN